jgi:hypothetical protein
MYAMKRTSLFLDEKLLERARRAARRQGVSLATVVREALAAYLVEPRGIGGVPPIAGRFASGASDTSERVDELLWRDPHR